MRAVEIVEESLPVAAHEDDAVHVLRLVASQRLPGLIVTRGTARPPLVVSTVDILRSLVPAYVQESPCLAHVYDEEHADRIADDLAGRRIGDIVPPSPAQLAVVDGQATLIELASVMIQLRCPLVGVRDGQHLRGVITASQVLECLLSPSLPRQARPRTSRG
ncbi:CBS domain-containing protein [Actinopolymorpha sp. B17G11]|uniref:CBS domain-containing protein n=1 Tax=unclassified Actinopolymorpha TaxID=2627063 RepID=UPI0032D9A4E8